MCLAIRLKCRDYGKLAIECEFKRATRAFYDEMGTDQAVKYLHMRTIVGKIGLDSFLLKRL